MFDLEFARWMNGERRMDYRWEGTVYACEGASGVRNGDN